MDVTDLDLDLPSLKREVTVRSLKEQPAEIQKMILEKLSLMDQVRAAAELALKHNRWTAVLLVNDINAVRLYSKFTADDAISDVIFAQREFRYEVVYCNLDSRTAAELKDIATHSLEWNMGVDRPSNDSKQKLGLPLHNSQAWPLLLARVQNDAMLSLQCTELRKKDDMVRYLASNRPQCLLDVIVDLIGAQSNTDFAFAPYDILCTCCLLSKFATPTASVYRLGCGGKICKDCLGPELERRYIRKFPSDACLGGIQQQF